MEKEVENEGLLISQEKYLASGIHIGTRIRTADMKEFIFKTRKDGLNILDLKKIDERIRTAAKLLKRFEPEEVMIVASRFYSGNAARKFAALTGIKIKAGRVIPGTFTNTKIDEFAEPKLLFICDPKGEKSALLEAAKMNIPVIALCDTDNETKYVDFIIPCNNKGRKSLALIFYLLTRELLLTQGKISNYSEFTHTIKEFEEFGDLKKDVVSVKPSSQ